MSGNFSGQKIAEILVRKLPTHWDGKFCVNELLAANHNWRQMEWIGFWFEFRARQILAPLGATLGPTFGNVVFDCAIDGVWDFKAHPVSDGAASPAYLNDEEAVLECLKSERHLGWMIAIGEAFYDTDGSFKTWHDELKGKASPYVLAGAKIGRASRRRKAAFELKGIAWFEFHSATELDTAVCEGWLQRGLQASQRNSNGKSRRAKFGFSYARWREYSDSTPSYSAGGIVWA